MPLFSDTVQDYWNRQFTTGQTLHRDDTFSLTINPELSEGRRLMLLESDGRGLVAMTPALAERLALVRDPVQSLSALRARLEQADVTLHGADAVFYFSTAEKAVLVREADEAPRRLGEGDAAAFETFHASASEQDLDDAYVELDHWAVFGIFEQQQLACAASSYPWDDSSIADMGVLTLPPYRGRRYARRVVRAISRYADTQGYEPQYRCQIDNAASVALARAAGFTQFGKWEVISPQSAW